MNATQFHLSSWSDISAIATVIKTFVIMAAALYARSQFREADRNRRLLATTELFRLIGEEEFRNLREWAMNELPDLDPTESQSVLTMARKVAVKYDRLAYMVHQDLLPRKALLDFQGDEIAVLWEKLEPAITFVRTSQNRPNYCCNLEQLGLECSRLNMKQRPPPISETGADYPLPVDFI